MGVYKQGSVMMRPAGIETRECPACGAVWSMVEFTVKGRNRIMYVNCSECRSIDRNKAISKTMVKRNVEEQMIQRTTGQPPQCSWLTPLNAVLAQPDNPALIQEAYGDDV